MSDFDLAAAIREFDHLYIEHSNFSHVLAEVREVLNLGPSPTEAICLHVAGPPGAGKTTLRRKLAQEFPRTVNGREYTVKGVPVVSDHIPLLQVEVPNRPTAKTICYAILYAYGERIQKRSDETEMFYRICNYAEACGTIGFLFDEAQRIVDKAGVVASEHILDLLKSIHARTGIPIILLGLRRLRYAFDQDAQIDRRWNAEIVLDGYWWKDGQGNDDLESRAMFIAILSAYREVFPIPLELDVEDEVTAFRFFYASQGLFGNLKKLLREAIRVASKRPRARVVDMKALEMAFDRAIRKEARGLENPFGSSFILKLPPRPQRDDLLLVPASERRKAKTRKARRLEIERVLTRA